MAQHLKAAQKTAMKMQRAEGIPKKATPSWAWLGKPIGLVNSLLSCDHLSFAAEHCGFVPEGAW
jgi:hypothetical protein